MATDKEPTSTDRELGGEHTGPKQLWHFEGIGVFGTGVEVRNAAGGFQDALKIAPLKGSIGQRVQVLLDCEIVEVDHKRIKRGKRSRLPEGALERDHALRADTALILTDNEVVLELVAAHRKAVRDAADNEAGRAPLEGMEHV